MDIVTVCEWQALDELCFNDRVYEGSHRQAPGFLSSTHLFTNSNARDYYVQQNSGIKVCGAGKQSTVSHHIQSMCGAGESVYLPNQSRRRRRCEIVTEIYFPLLLPTAMHFWMTDGG